MLVKNCCLYGMGGWVASTGVGGQHGVGCQAVYTDAWPYRGITVTERDSERQITDDLVRRRWLTSA